LFLIVLDLRFQELTGTRDGKTFLIKKLLNSQDTLDILAAIHPLTCTAFRRLELGELSLPKAQYISRETAEPSHFADAKIELLRN